MKLTKAQKRAVVAAMTAALFAPTPLAQIAAALPPAAKKTRNTPRKRAGRRPS